MIENVLEVLDCFFIWYVVGVDCEVVVDVKVDFDFVEVVDVSVVLEVDEFVFGEFLYYFDVFGQLLVVEFCDYKYDVVVQMLVGDEEWDEIIVEVVVEIFCVVFVIEYYVGD